MIFLSSFHHEGLPSGHFLSLRYHSTTTWVLSVNLVMHPAEQPWITSHIKWYSQHGSFYSLLFSNQSVLPSSWQLTFHLHVTLKVKRFYSRDWHVRVSSSFALSTSFILVNAFHPDFILNKISASMFWQTFITIRPNKMYSFTSSILMLWTTIQGNEY